MADERIGRQTPTVSVVLPYEETRGGEAVLLYNQSTKTALEWQELMMYDIMAVNPDSTWRHMKFGWSVPRQNGKSELLIMRAIWGLLHDERVLYTAHVVNTSHSAWEKITVMLDEMGFVENDDFKNLKNKGSEQIKYLKGKGVINFRTRTVKGGLGESYDLLIIDEAQEYTVDQEGALKYVIRASKNPQILMCGTPPTTVSSGTVFTNYRGKVLSGEGNDDGWAEWSVPFMSDTKDRDLWYETNPSLGVLSTEKILAEEFGDDIVNDNIQSLGLWLLFNLKSAITQKEWESSQTEKPPKLPAEPRLFFAAKFGKDDANLSLSVAVRLDEKSVFVEAIDCRPIRDGCSWVLPFLANSHADCVLIDGANGQQQLADEIKAAKVKIKTVLPTVGQVVAANAQFEVDLSNGKILHADQPALTQAATNCEHRAIGSGGGFGYRSLIDGADVTLLETITLAYWACANAKEKRKPRIGY
ncbi:MAG: terminase [Clostridia bacterium]|nr:terminase [Clostridia bacterium]